MKWILDNKWKLLTVFAVYILVCICAWGSFLTSYHFASSREIVGDNTRLQEAYEDWGEYALKPITVIKTVFDGGTRQQIFLIGSVLLFGGFGFMTGKLAKESIKDYDYQGEEHGSSAWSKNGEEFRKQPDGSYILNKSEGFILSKNHYLGTDPRKVRVNKNILVFGGSGSGKTASFVKPNILQKLGSYVITDPKGELYRETSGYLKANGYNVKVLNLVDTEYSNRYNPLAHIRDYSDVDIIAHTIVAGGEGDGGGKSADPFWDNTAKMLLKACIYYVISVLPEEERNLSSCLNIVRAGGSDESIFDRLFVGELKPEHPGRKEYEGIRVGADKTKQSIAISLVSKLTHFDSPNMQRLTTTNDIDFEELGERKTAIYVISPDSHSTYNYILTIFYGQLLQRLYALADRCGGALHQPTYLLLDEFANIGKIPDFNQKLSTSRSRLISMSIIVQSIDQLIDLYKDLHENIIANCDTQLFLGSQSIKTCEYFSKSLGQMTLTYQSKSKNRDEKDNKTQGYSYSEQRQGRELMTIDELKRMPYDDMIILIRGLKPIRTKKAWYYKFHPERENAKRYQIKDITEMPKPQPVAIKTMDVEKHINDRLRRAREVANSVKTNTGEVEIDVGGSTVSNTQTASNQEVATVDLQKELEKKFDELFGSSSSNKPQE